MYNFPQKLMHAWQYEVILVLPELRSLPRPWPIERLQKLPWPSFLFCLVAAAIASYRMRFEWPGTRNFINNCQIIAIWMEPLSLFQASYLRSGTALQRHQRIDSFGHWRYGMSLEYVPGVRSADDSMSPDLRHIFSQRHLLHSCSSKLLGVWNVAHLQEIGWVALEKHTIARIQHVQTWTGRFLWWESSWSSR